MSVLCMLSIDRFRCTLESNAQSRLLLRHILLCLLQSARCKYASFPMIIMRWALYCRLEVQYGTVLHSACELFFSRFLFLHLLVRIPVGTEVNPVCIFLSRSVFVNCIIILRFFAVYSTVVQYSTVQFAIPDTVL